ncbi:MAG: hypothetical protein LBD07_03340 [Spirochaetaceae bacterium]|jgi:hypothetical protein|nr:hypothetical protein [Spirochaetaceae bacterium]
MLQIDYFNVRGGASCANPRSIFTILHNFRIKKTIFLFAAILCLMLGCDQIPIFYTISKAPAPKKPKIPGSPTKIVARTTTSELYASNGNLWMAAAPNYEWHEISKPSGGTILDIAIVTDSLYVLVVNNKTSDTTIWCSDRSRSGSWHSVGNGANLKYQAIFGTDSELFICEWNGKDSAGGKNYNIITLANTVKTDTSLLSGVVKATNNYYFATQGDGIYYSSAAANPVTSLAITADNNTILGLTPLLSDKIAAVSSNGYIYQINDAVPPTISESSDLEMKFTKALVYYKNSAGGLLIVGVTASSTEFGYRELLVNGSGDITFALRYPGESGPTSVNDKETYITTIGQKTLNAVIQAGPNTDSLPLMFASTQKDGLWSFRHDSAEGRKIWNAED